MKKIFYFILLLTISLGFVACNDSEDNEWRDANKEAYEKITMDPEYEEIIAGYGYPRGVYKKVIKKGTGKVNPTQNDNVKLYYRGYYYSGTNFDVGTSATDDEVAATFVVSGTVRGFSTALQNMVVGDKWEVVIPYYLGYGATGLVQNYTTIIQGYTTLFFDIELLEIVE